MSALEWEREEMELLEEKAEAEGWSKTGPEYKRRVKYITKMTNAKMKEEVRSCSRSGAAHRMAAKGGGRMAWGDIVLSGVAKGKTFTDVKESFLPKFMKGPWLVDVDCPSSKGAGGVPIRRFILKEPDEGDGPIRVRVIRNANASYNVQVGENQEEDDDLGEDAEDGAGESEAPAQATAVLVAGKRAKKKPVPPPVVEGVDAASKTSTDKEVLGRGARKKQREA